MVAQPLNISIIFIFKLFQNALNIIDKYFINLFINIDELITLNVLTLMKSFISFVDW